MFMNFIKKHIKTVVVILTVTVCFILSVLALFMLSDYQDEIADRAAAKSQYNTVVIRTAIEEKIDEYVMEVVTASTQMNSIHNNQDLKSFFGQQMANTSSDDSAYDLVAIRYFYKGVLYDQYTDVYTVEDTQSVEHYQNDYSTAAFIGSYNDTGMTMTLSEFYAPVNNCDVCDAIVYVYTRQKFETVMNQNMASENAEFSVLCTNKGIILVGDETMSKSIFTGEDVQIGSILDVLRTSIGDKEPIDELTTLISDKADGTIKVTIGINDYIISVGSSEKMLDMAIIEVYDVNNLCDNRLDNINAISAIICIFVITLVGVIIFLFLHNKEMNKRLMHIDTVDHELVCNNRAGFEKEANTIMSRNVNSYFATINLQIRHFDFIKENNGESEANNLLKYIRVAVAKFIQGEECYGHISEGDFLLLLHAGNQEELKERLKVLSFVISKYRGHSKFDIILRYGIYEIDLAEKLEVSQTVDFAIEANHTVKNDVSNATMTFNFYDSELRKIRKINESMELRMESALKNGEFQVFFQPKYNLNTNKQDGCEALVRWYDPTTGVYNRPDLFMALFESNGFVIKLDKYVFERVCEYINYSIAHGIPVYPISVNASRVTATQKEFVEFYAMVKRRYQIADDLLTVEFTESFAYENYETLLKIVNGLHQNGFKCSLDDFGCGYSSFQILKSLPMDELKLDRMFLNEGIDKERDNCIYESVVKLGKRLNMKVTQEGVEDQAGIDYIRKMGVDVVQGYFYSRPIPVSDYVPFCKNSREHDIK